MALPDGWCIFYSNNTTNDIVYTLAIDAGPVLICFTLILICLTIVYYRVNTVTADHVIENGASDSFNSFNETVPLLQSRSKSSNPSKFRPIRKAQGIINSILVTFLVCYSVVVYIEIRNIAQAMGLKEYEYVTFVSPDSPPQFNDVNLTLFRLKFTLTIAFSIFNPILVFRGSTVFRNQIGAIFEIDDFSYIISRRDVV